MFYNNLKAQRLRSGLSQKQVADFLQVSPQSVSKWERGEALPSIDYLPKLAEYLNCDINSFFVKEEKAAINYSVINSFFALMTEVLNSKNKKSEDVAAFVLDHADAMHIATTLCADLMEYKTINIRNIRGMLDCSDVEARSFVECLEQCGMVEKLDIEDSYYVVKNAVEGFILLLKIQKQVCDIINKVD